MGLDITAYSKLKKLDVVFDAHGEPIDPTTREPFEEWYQPYINSDFGANRYAGIEDRAVYSYDNAYSFSAGSYGGYNGWREDLAKLAGYPAIEYERVQGYAPSRELRCDAAAWSGKCEGMPFVELVNFSDCEGVISAATSAKLAKDFADFDERAKTFAGCGAYFYTLFQEWRKAFEMAADGGAVDFH